MEPTPQQIAAEEHDHAQYQSLNKIIKRYGGRHLIFRTNVGGMRLVPRPYALISSFSGPVWAFYGLGQIWLTHKKSHKIGGWMARMPRFGGEKVQKIVDAMEPQLNEFITFCNETGIEGTVIVETKVIEFHWTFGFELQDERKKNEHCETLDAKFHTLVDRYLAVKKQLEPAS